MSYKFARVDDNQKDIVKKLRTIGATVMHCHTLGHGAPDIVVGYRGKNYLCEIKDPAKPPSQRQLTSDEVEFHNEWKGQIAVIETIEDFLILARICTGNKVKRIWIVEDEED
jgi:Holliday junction resolvase